MTQDAVVTRVFHNGLAEVVEALPAAAIAVTAKAVRFKTS